MNYDIGSIIQNTTMHKSNGFCGFEECVNTYREEIPQKIKTGLNPVFIRG